jgi:hypothetical protein
MTREALANADYAALVRLHRWLQRRTAMLSNAERKIMARIERVIGR